MFPKKLLFILIILISVSIVTFAKWKSTYLKPKNAKTKYATIFSGKARYYYPIEFNNPTILTVRGPGELRVITRALFSPDENEELNYEIRYNIDGGKEEKKTNSVSSLTKLFLNRRLKTESSSVVEKRSLRYTSAVLIYQLRVVGCSPSNTPFPRAQLTGFKFNLGGEKYSRHRFYRHHQTAIGQPHPD